MSGCRWVTNFTWVLTTLFGVGSAIALSGKQTPKPLKQQIQNACPVCSAPQAVGKTPIQLQEASALAASVAHPGVYYTMNDDHRGIPEVLAIKETGEVAGSFLLSTFDMHTNLVWSPGGHDDFESLAVGPCDSQAPMTTESCLYIGNTGQNCAREQSFFCPWRRRDGLYSILRVPEPKRIQSNSSFMSGDEIWFRLPAGHRDRDIETMMVDSKGAILLATKENIGPSSIFRLSASKAHFEQPLVAEYVTAITHGSTTRRNNMITDGVFRESITAGSGITLVTYDKVLFYPYSRNRTFGDALSQAFCKLPLPHMRQCEGITWGVGGSPFYLVIGEGVSEPIWRVNCSF